jgi:hypothetical protein
MWVFSRKAVTSMFIGRESEMRKLNQFYASSKYEMVVVYGRRRVGKTRLLTEFIKGKNAIFYVAEENNDLLNKAKFSRTVLNHFEESINISFDFWEDIFKYIAKQKQEEKLVIVIDELPYIAFGNPSFMSILQNIIDHVLIDKNIMLVLCGSSISFMENEIVAHKSPLYGRKTGQMKILPLDYYNAGKFFSMYSPEDKFRAYSVLGGIPHYLLHFRNDLSVDENIIRSFMNNASFLYDEPRNLLHQELRNPAVYNTIVEAIADGASKMNEIATKIGETPSKTNKYLRSLLELEIVEKKTPVNDKKSKKTIYWISDNLYNFMFRYVYSNRSLIEQDLGEALYYRSVKEDLDNLYGRVFEEVCVQYLMRKNKLLQLEFMVENFGGWWGNNPILKKQEEIDIVGLSKTEGLYCECKYRNEKLGIRVYEKLVERSHLLPKAKRYYYLFSKNGFSDRLIELSKADENVRLFTLSDLYEPME